jgi:hypothetical protein
MKKTLTNLLSLSLFVLLSSFSLFSYSADFPTTNPSFYTSRYNPSTDKMTCGTTTTPNTNCTGSNTVISSPCNGSGLPAKLCTGTAVSNQSVPNTGSCPSNSTINSSTCTPNTGFSSVNTNGTWSVVPAGQECSSSAFLYNSATGVCDSVTENTVCPPDKPHARWAVIDQTFYCSADSLENSIGVLAGVSGVSLIALSGAYATALACVASLLCAIGGVLTIVGAATLGFDLLPEGQTNDQIPPAPPGKIQIVPLPADYTPLPNVIKVPPNGALIPPSNVTPKASNPEEFELTKDGVKYDFKPKQSIVTFDGISGGVRESGAIQTGSGGSIDYKRVTQQPHGTVGGQPIKKRTYQQGTYTGGGSGQQMGEIVEYENETTGDITSSPPVLDAGTGQTGDGTGGGDCSLEPQKCLLLTNIQNALKGTGTNGELVLTGLDVKQDQVLSDFQAQAQSLVQSFYNSDLWANQFLSSMTDTPNPFSYLGNKSGSCAYSFNAPGGQQTLDMCPHLDVIHPAMAFGFFILLMFGIRDLILEKETT